MNSPGAFSADQMLDLQTQDSSPEKDYQDTCNEEYQAKQQAQVVALFSKVGLNPQGVFADWDRNENGSP